MSIHPEALAGAHMECRSLERTASVFTELLAFERVRDGTDSITVRHPNTAWTMTLHAVGPDAPPKDSANHYGVRVVTKDEVASAYGHLQAHAEEFGLSGIRPPENQHGACSVYFVEPSTNTLEIESYEDVNRKAAGIERLGGVRGPHWSTPLPPERFPGRGYVPQALTHGTLAVANPAISHRFYSEVLGLDVHIAYGEGRVAYIKHPATKHFIVCARRERLPINSPAFRYTLTLASDAELVAAHSWMLDHRDEFAMQEVREIDTSGDTASFLVRDPDFNWWEIAVQA